MSMVDRVISVLQSTQANTKCPLKYDVFFFSSMALQFAHRCEIAVKNREQGIMNIKLTETQLIDKQREFILLD